jgi:uncharacterized membrane protein YuzA (DUF378 family)
MFFKKGEMMKPENILMLVAYLLVIIGAVNWGLVGLFNVDLVAQLLGDQTIVARVVYVLVGISGLLLLPKLHTCVKD